MTDVSLTTVFDERNNALKFKSDYKNINTHTDKIWQMFGEEYKYINGTYKALIDKPEVFGINSLNFLYALYIGKQYKKEALYLMFRSFMNKAPETSESNVLFLWAEELRKYKTFIDFEPTFKKLNQVLSAWFSKRTVKYNGKEIPLTMFRPILYNTYGINVIELLPYIAYLFTYLIYGYPFKFSDAYSSSSLKDFYNLLENWFMSCYNDLYKEQGISILNVQLDTTIPDSVWEGFYERMLDAKKIIEIRNEEINKTSNMLISMTKTQQGIVEEDLYDKFNIVLTKLIDAAIGESSYKNILNKINGFDEKYYVPIETVNLTSYFVSETKNEIIIDEHNNYKYMLYNGTYKPLPHVFNINRPKTGLKPLNYCLGKPYVGADILLEIFIGMLKERFMTKRSDQFDSPIYLYPGNLEDDKFYNFIMPFFVRGIWAMENQEMSIIINNLMINEKTRIYIEDMLNAYDTFKIIYGYTPQAILAPIYMLSLLNTWLYQHCSNNMDLNTFNPFIYMKQTVLIDSNRVNKLQDILYSMLFINNDEYIKMTNNLNAEFYETIQSNPLILMPYIQTINDDSTVFALGGCECYKYSKSVNPFTRSYGFISNVMGVDEGINVLYRYLETIENPTVFELIKDNKTNTKTIIDTIITASKMEEKIPAILYHWSFYIENGQLTYNERANTEFAEMIDPDTGKYVVEIMMKYSFNQSETKNVLDDEVIRIKEYLITGNMKLDVSIPTSINKYVYNNKLYNVKISPMGETVYLPYYGVKTDISVRNVNFVNPEGKYLRKVIVPTTGNEDNNLVFWVYTIVKPYSKYQSYVHLNPSGIKPSDGSYMLTDRIQQFPKF